MKYIFMSCVFLMSFFVQISYSYESIVNDTGNITINAHNGYVTIEYFPPDTETESIERLALDANFGKTIVGIPQLYDDGTHGDKVADDGTYSIEIKIPEGAKQVKLLFYVLDTDGNEVEIGPVVREIPSSTE